MNLGLSLAPTKKFKDYPFNDRLIESTKVRKKYPDRIPVIVEKIARSTIPVLTKKKYLVPMDYTVGQFIGIIHQKMCQESVKLTPHQAIFLFVNGVIPATGANLSQVYQEHKDKDGFLYINYSGENVFGSEENSLESPKQSVLKFLMTATV